MTEAIHHSVLVVEDEKSLASVIKLKLEKTGFEVGTANSVDSAWKYLQNHPLVEMVWLDHYLLGKDSGLNLVSKMKKDNKWADTVIFVVSNTASDANVKSYLDSGVKKYYVKAEHRLEEIISDIKSFLEKPQE